MQALTIAEAAQLVRKTHTVAVPTEAVYGLSCLPNVQAVQQLLAIKNRPEHKGLILVAAQIEQLDTWVDWSVLSEQQIAAMQDVWPGPYTWIVPVRAEVDPLLTGGRDSIAVRVTDHPVMRELCLACDSVLVSTSANITGQPPVKVASELDGSIVSKIAGVVAGTVGNLNQPTTIRDALTGARIR